MAGSIDFEGRLNPEQYKAVCHDRGPLLVLAGAGSGKTRVLTHRVAHLILESGVPPASILAVTFTNKAAAEMSERVYTLLDSVAAPIDPKSAPTIGTFHRTCARLLRVYASELGLNPRFVIYDDSDQRSVLKRAIDSLEIEVTPKFVSQCAVQIDHFKNQGIDPNLAMEEAVGGDAEQVARIYEAYQKALHAAGCLDFGDLLLQTLLLLQHKGSVRRRLWRRWRHIMVDEFQDTNAVQYEMLRLLVDPETRNLAVVGDDDQSIYGWRGATVRNILDFGVHYPDAEVVKLEQNYRSTQVILDASGAVIDKLEERTGKVLWTDKEGGEPISVFTGVNAREEASWVARQLGKLLTHQGYESHQCAVFYRTNAQARALEEQFRAVGLGYRLVGGQSFYNRGEVKDVLAYLKAAINPNDTVNLLRILNKPTRSLGPKTLEKLENLIVLGLGPETLFEAIEYAIHHTLFTRQKAQRLALFHRMIKGLAQRISEGEPPSEMTEELIEEIGYLSFLDRKHPMDSEERKDNVLDLLAAMQDFEAENPGLGLGEFLERSTLHQQGESDRSEEGALARPPVTMMTVHASKGLEFDAVFVIGMEDGLFPLTRPGRPNDLDEERRLCYVAITRARERLHLSNARSRRIHGGAEGHDTRPSRFLADIPADLMRVSPESAERLVIWREPHAAQALEDLDDFDFDQRPQPTPKRKSSKKKPIHRIDHDPLDQRTHEELDEVGPPPEPEPPDPDKDPLIGRIVTHPREGIGEIIDTSGFGPRATLTVRFATSNKELKVVRKFVKVY